MLLTVRVAAWELEASGRILSVGDQVRCWLDFEVAERGTPATEPGEAFEVVLAVPGPARGIPVGTTETSWTGVLIDLETAESDGV